MADESLTTKEGPPKRRFLVAVLSVLGLGIGFLSWLLSSIEPWWSSTLGNVAVAVLLLVPAELALRWVRSGFNRVERATDEVRVTAESAQESAQRAESSLADVRQAIIDRQVAEHSAKLDVFKNMVANPSRESLIAALVEATHAGTITAKGVRSPVWETDLHYRFVLQSDGQAVQVQLEADDGSVLSVHPWSSDTPPQAFYQELVEAVRDAGRDLGVMLNDPTQSVEALSEMLVDVGKLRAQELMGYRDRLTQIIERVDGWYFTERSVIPADDLRYEIRVERLNEMDWEEHLHAKGWYGAGPALNFARRLYGVSSTG